MEKINGSYVVGLDIGRHSSRIGIYNGLGRDVIVDEELSMVCTAEGVGDYGLGDVYKSIRIECLSGSIKDVEGDYFIGSNVRDLGVRTTVVTEGEAFIKDSCKLILALLFKRGVEGDVIISHVLTEENLSTHSTYKDILCRRWVISSLCNPSLKKEINITAIYKQRQSVVDVYDLLMSNKLEVQKEIAEKKGLSVNIGRKTIDFSILQNLNIVNPQSVNIGSYVVLRGIKSKVGAKLSMAIDDDRAEDFLRVPSILLNSKKEDVSKEVSEAIKEYWKVVKPSIDQFLSLSEVSWICMSGGGSIFLRKYLEDSYSSYTLYFPSKPTFSSVIGLVKWLSRSLKQG